MNKVSSKIIYLDNASTSLKLNSFIQKLLDSYSEGSWIREKKNFLDSLFLKLSRLFELNPSQISLIPSSSYGINVLWEHLLLDINDKKQIDVLISKSEHISNITSLIQFKEREKDRLNVVIEYYDSESIVPSEVPSQKIILLTIKDNLGLKFWTREEIEALKRKQPSWIFIGDFTQVMAELMIEGELVAYIQLFDYFYFSAHKFFGPFGIGVIGSKGKKNALNFNFRSHSLESRAKLDWRSIYVWEQAIEEIVNFVLEGKEKKESLIKYWVENFPHSAFLSYVHSPKSLIFLVKLNWTERDLLNSHDFIFFLDFQGLIFRANDLCSSYSELVEHSIIRFSLSILNTEEELEELFKLMTAFDGIRSRKSIKI